MQDSFSRLEATIAERRAADPSTSYVAKLTAGGRAKIAQKLGEEAVETVIAAVENDRSHLIAESADLLYHLLVLLKARGVTLEEVEAALAQRTSMSGLEEKASRRKD
jgi:phosphoribosyl-ATP pyrophosphohydrolase